MLLSLCALHRFLLKMLVFIMPVVIPSIDAASRKIHSYPTPSAVTQEDYLTSAAGNNSVPETTTTTTTTTWAPPKSGPPIYSSIKNDAKKQRSMSPTPTGSGSTIKVNYYSNPSEASSFNGYSDYSANSSPVGEVSYETDHLSPAYYNNSDYYYNNNNNSSSYANYQNYPYRRGARISTSSLQGQSNHQAAQTAATFPSYSSAEQGSGYSTLNFGDYLSDGLQYNYGHAMSQHREHNEDHGHEGSIEIEDKVFSKTVVATKALKAGKVVMTFFMVLVVLAIACLGKLGVAVSPVVLPFALLPLGVIALLLFIPLFLLFIPLAATGLAGERRKRRKRDTNQYNQYMGGTDVFVDNIILSIEG